jgi:hypothetical protein
MKHILQEKFKKFVFWGCTKIWDVTYCSGGEAVDANSLGDLADGERETVYHSRGVGDDDHLARLGSCTHTPYLAHHCR